MQILGSAELREDVQNKGLCVNCGSCIGQCPYLKSYKGKVAMLFPCTMPEGRCYANCPKTEVDYDKLTSVLFNKSYDGSPLGHYIEVKKGRAGSKMKSGSGFQNGGVVSALITCAMDNGMIDAAALTSRKELVPLPVIATNVDEVLECSTSKYMAASTIASVNEYAAEGKDKLGVVGTPCQLTGVAQIRQNPLARDGFKDPVALSIGLFCTWAVDTRKFVDLVSAMTDMSKITSMDVPPPPANIMEIVAGDEKIDIPLDEIRKIVPAGCSICPDMTSEFTDISVGALEGDAAYNTIIIRTDKGLKLVQEAFRNGYIDIDDAPERSIENLKKGAAGKKRRALVKAEELKLLNNRSENERSAILMKEDIVKKIIL